MDLSQYESGAVAAKPGAPASPSSGYPTDGDPSSGTPATTPGAYWFYQMAQELNNLLTQAGVTPDHTKLTQLFDMLEARYALSGLSGDNYVTVAAGGAISASDSGKIISASGNVALPPPAPGLNYQVHLAKNAVLSPDGTSSAKLFLVGGSAFASYTAPDYTLINLYCDGVNWINAGMSGAVKTLPAANPNEAVAYSQVLGLGQTWLNYSSSGQRVTGTVYTNSTGKPIMVSVTTAQSGSDSYALQINGTSVALSEQATVTGNEQLCVIVPAGATYAFTNSGTGSGFSQWWELR